MKFEYEDPFLNEHLIRELTRTLETREQIRTEMMQGLLKGDWRIPLDTGQTDVPTRGPAERTSGFLFFFGPFFFSFHKEKKKGSKRFDMKEKFYLKNKLEG